MIKGRLGIIGCGQLSQMLGEAANRLGFSVSYLCGDETPVVAGLGPIYYPEQLDEFLGACDAVTVERESLPDDMLRQASNIGLVPRYVSFPIYVPPGTSIDTIKYCGLPDNDAIFG